MVTPFQPETGPLSEQLLMVMVHLDSTTSFAHSVPHHQVQLKPKLERACCMASKVECLVLKHCQPISACILLLGICAIQIIQTVHPSKVDKTAEQIRQRALSCRSEDARSAQTPAPNQETCVSDEIGTTLEAWGLSCARRVALSSNAQTRLAAQLFWFCRAMQATLLYSHRTQRVAQGPSIVQSNRLNGDMLRSTTFRL